MLTQGKLDRGVLEIVDMESLVPPDHLLRKIDAAVDFGKLYELAEPLYSEDEGRSIDPAVLFELVLIQHLDGIALLLWTLRRAQADVAYRWFLRYKLQEKLPHFSKLAITYGIGSPRRPSKEHSTGYWRRRETPEPSSLRRCLSIGRTSRLVRTLRKKSRKKYRRPQSGTRMS